MGSTLKIAVDRQNRTLVPFAGSVGKLPDFFQSNTLSLLVQVVDPPILPLDPYVVVDLATFGMRVSVGQQPTGTAGGPSPLALQDTMTWDPAAKLFKGDLALNTTDIDTYIGAAAAKGAWFEINLTFAGARNTILQTMFNLKAVVDELTSLVPTPTDQFLTKAECLALFAKYVNDAGKTIVFTSPTTGKLVELGANDDGSFMADSI